jgi:Ser/Thr protein kinase RdoA (MazF antagonist)
VAVEAYGLDRESLLEHLPQGRVNLTFLVTSGRARHILQRLHPVLGEDGAVVENGARVAEILIAAGLAAPRTRPSLAGFLWVEDQGLWRMLDWLPGRPGNERSGLAAAEAVRQLALFHRALALSPPLLRVLPPADFNIEGLPGREYWRPPDLGGAEKAGRADADRVLARGAALASGLPAQRPVTRLVVHGDPKLENFLFDGSGRASALIDLDTVRWGALLWELADALRSWCGLRGADDRVDFDHDIFKAAVTSYLAHGQAMARGEWLQLPAAVAAVSLKLARRYLIDFYQESYFVWDRERYSSLSVQNLRRGAGLLVQAEHLIRHGPDLVKWLESEL